jgi:hypothetical protein
VVRASPYAIASLLGLCLCACRKDRDEPRPLPEAAAAVPVEVAQGRALIYFRDLSAYLPDELSGYALQRDEGSTGKYGEVSVSEAERVFGKDGREVRMRVVDTSLAPALVRKIREAVREGYQKEPADPTAPILLKDAVGYVTFDDSSGAAEANLVVSGDRFLVALSTRGWPHTIELRRVARELNLAGLSKLR